MQYQFRRGVDRYTIPHVRKSGQSRLNNHHSDFRSIPTMARGQASLVAGGSNCSEDSLEQHPAAIVLPRAFAIEVRRIQSRK